jgi:hypothetical protein
MFKVKENDFVLDRCCVRFGRPKRAEHGNSTQSEEADFALASL